jgi:colanic acid biosynthesis glycosyl transferase WcaI
VYNVQELYPDIAITLGALKNQRLIGLFYALERFVYARAGAITVIAERMRRRILDKGVPASKIRVIPNFVDVTDMVPLSKANPFSRQHGLDRIFVVTYAGNMGPAQGLETVLEAASRLRHQPQLKFVLVGDGGSHDRIKAMACDRGLKNVLILPHQSYALVPQIYATSDVCLVPLAPDSGFDAIPSKVYRIMACARPVLACADPDSDLAELISRAQCGIVVPPRSPETLAEAVSEALQNVARCRAMGEAGRAHVIDHYARGSISPQYQALVCEMTA